MDNLTGLATGIGSLPFSDAQAAVDAVFSFLPELPFWPQLPKRSKKEGMILQYAGGLPCLKIQEDELVFDSVSKESELEIFYDRIIREDIAAFAIDKEQAAGLYAFKERLIRQPSLLDKIRYIKGQITGPFTYACGLKDEQGVSLMHSGIFMQAVTQGLAMKALWQGAFFEEFGKPMLMFIDEPFMSSFGSAYTPLNRKEVIDAFSELARYVKPKGMLVGVHCCGNTDWSIFTDIEGIDIINFDAFGFLDKFALYAGHINAFLRRGGYICWGIVPTQDGAGNPAARTLKERLSQGLEMMVRKGVSSSLLSERLLLSPSCGLGTLEPQKASGILKLLSEISALLRP